MFWIKYFNRIQGLKAVSKLDKTGKFVVALGDIWWFQSMKGYFKTFVVVAPATPVLLAKEVIGRGATVNAPAQLFLISV